MAILAQALETIRRQAPEPRRLGIILGSGLGAVVELLADRRAIPYESIPGFPRTTALGHAGQLWLGEFAGLPAVMLQGRFHRYEGHSTPTLMLPVRVLHGLGVETLIITNASGGLDPRFRPGDLMVLRDHVNLQWLGGFFPREAGRELYRAGRPIYDPELIERTLTAARQEHLDIKQGVYVGVQGPNYETRAEYRMFRRIGGDAVGMSTIAEATAAADLGLRVLGLSLIANVALPDAPEQVAHEQVLRAVASAAGDLGRVLRRLVISCPR